MAPSSRILRLAAASVACTIVAGAALPPVARAAGALPLLLYLPGRCWLAAFLPARTSGGEVQVLSVALSLALAILLGLVLNTLGFLGPSGWLGGLVVLCLVACVIAVVTRAKPSGCGVAVSVPPFGKLRLGAIVVAGGLATFAYAEARRGALQQRPDLYTDFWIVPQQGPAPSLAIAGVRNREERDTTYAIDIVARGRVVDRGGPFTLASGSERTLSIALPSVAFTEALPPSPWSVAEAAVADVSKAVIARDRVELRLFKDGDRGAVYRRVWVALPPPVATKPDVAALDAPAGELQFSGSVGKTLRATLKLEEPARAGDAAKPASLATAGTTLRDATSRLDQSQATALRMPDTMDASQALRAAMPPGVLPNLYARRFAPPSQVPADPTPIQPE